MFAAAVLVLGAVEASPAAAAEPWWQLSSSSRPTYIQPGSAADEVQELTVSATAGTFTLNVELTKTQGTQSTAPIPFNAPASTVRAALEALSEVGPGNVEVSGGPGATAPYTISFTGALADRPVSIGVLGEKLSGGTAGPSHRATLSELAHGRPDGEVALIAENLGDAALDAEADPVTLTDVLPPGLKALAVAGSEPEKEGVINKKQPLGCRLAPAPSCSFEGRLAPYESLELRVAVEVQPGAETGELNQVAIEGGDAEPASLSRPISLAGSAAEPTPFGLEDFRTRLEAEGGGLDSRAGAHPFQMTTTVAVNQGPDAAWVENSTHRPQVNPAVLPKDIYTKFPPGFIGDPTPLATCTLAQFLNGNAEKNECPAASAVGVASVDVEEPVNVGFLDVTVPLFNLEPSFGEPALLGFYVSAGNVPVLLDASLRSGPGEGALPGQSEDYGVDVNATNISQTVGFTSARVTVWGVPGDSRHDSSRGWGCLAESFGSPPSGHAPCTPAQEPHPPAFLTAPTSCAGPMAASVEADSWLDPGIFGDYLPSEPLPTLGGCNKLPFAPTIHAEPTSDAATSPTGLGFELSVPNSGLTNSNEGALASSEVKKAVVTLPQGFTTNPSVAEGLKACGRQEYESTTVQPGTGCTEESKIGTVEVESPVVKQTVKGSLFVAKQKENPYENLLTLYMVLRNPELGVLIKQALKVEPNEETGQLTTTVDNIPQLPFSHFKLSFRQGQRSPLVTPPACGEYTAHADLYPYSNPTEPVPAKSSFLITAGPEGQECPGGGLPPFHPNLEAGTINNAAGTYSPFYVHISRHDSEQEITHFSIKLPPGVVGNLSGVPECSDAAILHAKSFEKVLGGGTEEEEHPACPASSEIGHTLVGSGVGNVLAYAPGKLYLAGPYNGSQLSIVSITAAKVGPFDLGTVVVRFALKINPETAEVSVDGQGSDPIPHIVDGIPIHLRDIRSYVDRPKFTLNPTGCEPTSTASTVLGAGLNFVSSADDNPITVTSPFQAADCASLGFKPELKLSLKGSTKRGGTPAFKAVLHMPPSGDANIAQAQVTLPHSEFLDNAHIGTVCTRVQFAEGNVPGEKCPAASLYGHAKAISPILSEPLEGPVYLRSTGTGAGHHLLPDLVAALHNNQVNIALDGHVEGVHGGIRNTFEAVPDAPATEFVLEMQGGSKGLLENSTNLCAKPNHANAVFTGHNGKVEKFNPLMEVKCPKGHKHHKRAHRRHHR